MTRSPRPPRTRLEFLRRQRCAIGARALDVAREAGISVSLVNAVEQGRKPLTDYREAQYRMALGALRRRAWEGIA